MGIFKSIQAVVTLITALGPLLDKLRALEKSPQVQEVLKDLDEAYHNLVHLLHGEPVSGELQEKPREETPSPAGSPPSA